MIMALSAFQRRSKPNRGSRVYTINHLISSIFFGMNTRFNITRHRSMKSSGDFLIQRRIRQEITRELFDRELIKRHISIQGINDPITVGPGGEVHVGVVAPSVGIAGGIEPIERHMLGVFDGGEKGVDGFFVSLLRMGFEVGLEGVELGLSRWKSGEVEANASEPTDGVGLG